MSNFITDISDYLTSEESADFNTSLLVEIEKELKAQNKIGDSVKIVDNIKPEIIEAIRQSVKNFVSKM